MTRPRKTLTWKGAVLLGACLVLSATGCRRQTEAPVITPEPAVDLPADLKAFFDTVTDGNTAAVRTALSGRPEWTAAKGEAGLTALHLAATMGHEDMVELLIERGADVNGRDASGSTPLHHAAAGGNKAVVELLLAKGADVNARDNKNRTPLYLAKDAYPRVAEVLARQAAKQNP